MIRIKICGLTTMEDIHMMNALKPDYVGFIFAPSRRRVDPEYARQLTRELDPNIGKVGVFVNECRHRIEDVAVCCGLDVIQMHGKEEPEDCIGLPAKVWKAIPMKNEKSMEALDRYDVDGFVLDTWLDESFGGVGRAFPWKWTAGEKSSQKIIMAGGLHSGNVRQLLDEITPFGIDVSSGVECQGKKDFIKVKEFITAVKEAEKCKSL